MKPMTHAFSFSGALLQRGFWLYVWEIVSAERKLVYYVGRTGDSSSMNAQSPFNRMGQHLGFNENGNVLRRRLKAAGIDPDACTFRMVAHGPLLEEAATDDEHLSRRDRVAALERALAEAMAEAGYEVLNTVRCRVEVDSGLFTSVRSAFAAHFGKLGGKSKPIAGRRNRGLLSVRKTC